MNTMVIVIYFYKNNDQRYIYEKQSNMSDVFVNYYVRVR